MGSPLSPLGQLQPQPPPPVRSLEVQTIVLAVGGGMWLGIAQSFSYSTGPIYRYMRAADEWTWTCTLLLGAIIWMFGVRFYFVRPRQIGLMMISVVWFLIVLCFLAGNPHAFTSWTYGVLAISAGYCSLRLPL